MSAWFHGESIMGDRKEQRRFQGTGKAPEDLQTVATARARYENYSPGLRSPTSKRSLFDQGHSPINYSRPLTSDPLMDSAPTHGLDIDLALATSNVVPTATFHAVFIFFILLLTMIFAHFLIRLCMLSSRLGANITHKKARSYRAHATRPPIRLIQSRDEEEALPSNDRVSVDTDKDLPPPPPAYGWWRGSVRVDPEDIRYHDPDQTNLQQRTRNLVFAGSGHAPPSYTSQEELSVVRPAPLFNGVRGFRREDRVRDV
ncbi:MAG: hypothetical protein Q9163_003447 [Psora crenata]